MPEFDIIAGGEVIDTATSFQEALRVQTAQQRKHVELVTVRLAADVAAAAAAAVVKSQRDRGFGILFNRRAGG